MRKIIVLVGMFLFLGAIYCFSQTSEQITITTYYPSPYGSYKQLSIYNLDESLTQTDFTQSLNYAGINITTDYTANAFTPGIFWSTQNNNPTFPKAGIYLQETANGTYMYFGTSNAYATGITNDAVVIDYDGNVNVAGAITRMGFFQAYTTASQSHIATATLIHEFGGETREDADYYSHSTSSNTEDIIILQDGWYKISYSISFETGTYTNRIAYRGYVTANGTDISPSDGYSYSRYNTYARHATVTATFIYQASTNDVLNVRTQIYDNNGGPFGEDTQDTNSIANECWILIEKI